MHDITHKTSFKDADLQISFEYSEIYLMKRYSTGSVPNVSFFQHRVLIENAVSITKSTTITA